MHAFVLTGACTQKRILSDAYYSGLVGSLLSFLTDGKHTNSSGYTSLRALY